jgi:multicomponent Na+:H+ antiporter subunit C
MTTVTAISLTIFLIGLYGIIAKDNLIKKVIAFAILDSGIVLFFISSGYRRGASAPIIVGVVRRVVDPVPQALMLTAIVIGICIVALALSISIRIYDRYGTLNVSELKDAPED